VSYLALEALEIRERDYSPSSCIGGNYQPFIAAYKSDSVLARTSTAQQGAIWSTHQYGLKQSQSLDFCIPPLSQMAHQKPALLLFIHGGYWQELSAEASLFPAPGCIENGIAFAALDYTLAPHATVAQIVEECRSAVSWLVDHALSLGFDANRIVLAGSSAGAHVAASVGLTHAAYLYAVVLVSGVFDLRPLVGTSINEAVGLTSDTAYQQSPLFFVHQGFPRALVCWGEIETRSFKLQSETFANVLRNIGTSCTTFEVAGRNHFDVIFDLTVSSTLLGKDTLALLSHE
jgi:arylformamidase